MENEFKKVVDEILENDIEEIIDNINHSQLEKIKSRPHIKLPNGLNYIKNSYEFRGNLDYKIQFDITAEKAFEYVKNNDFKKGLSEEIKLFIIRLNPQHDDLMRHEPVNQVNINNLNILIELCDVKDLEILFNSNWNESDLKHPLIPKTKSFKFLKCGLKGENTDILNKKVEKYYFKEEIP